jgi:SAM-dependent methyltransferase
MTEQIRNDFDRLAQFDEDGWTHNNHYHSFLLKHVPASCENALEIGCGTGAFSRLLAERSQHVLGLDLAPKWSIWRRNVQRIAQTQIFK